ncbi:MAG: hypothetical protein VCA74_01395, partial [Deltaproteobacteria bacterium]
AISEDLFYIVPEKCTECVGFYDEEACAAVCPVDCCIPDPEIPEEEPALIARAREIHPDKEFEEEFPSRFRQKPADAGDGGDGDDGQSEAAPAAAVAAAVAPASSAAEAVGGRVEKVVSQPGQTLSAGNPGADFDGELGLGFDQVFSMVSKRVATTPSRLVGMGLLLASPLLGALDHRTKAAIEKAFGDRRFFSSQRATAINIIQNFILYPALAFLAGAVLGSLVPYTESDKGWIFIGIAVAAAETMARLGNDIFKGVPVAEMKLGASIYGAPMAIVLRPLIGRLLPETRSGWVPVEGYYSNEFEGKRERERRYGEVYTVTEYDRGYHVHFELPRTIPPSGVKAELGIGDEMPDYDLNVAVDGSSISVRGSVVDKTLRTLCSVSSSFPPDFKTEIQLDGALGGFRHRYADKTLEIAVLKQGA